VLIAATWRFRSWLMGVFENVVVLGRSGADLESELFHLETELLHHETSEQPGDATDLEDSPGADAPDKT
jgi:hypothetical protein